MRTPGFWSRTPPTLFARALSPLGAVLGAITARRMAQEGAPSPLPVVCIGNPVAGGAGKTPTALIVAELLKGFGHAPVFLSRGYGGRAVGPLLVDPQIHSAAETGDEPLLLARTAPTIVARDRVAGASLAAAHGSVIVMDDGFQNPSLRKDLVFLVVDGGSGIGNGLCLPAGPLRAPLGRQLPRAHALVLIGEGEAGEAVADLARAAALPVHRAHLVPDPEIAVGLPGRRVLAFAGIGRPEKFADTLRRTGADVVDLVSFADHRPLTAEDAALLLDRSRRDELILVTTEKDRVRIGRPAQGPLAELASSTHVLPVTLRFEKETAVRSQLSHLRAG
ncbi:tetraacyldisaccharide 4'-kinase [Terrihabitans sp. B22-R8]|uniref:tetraacyldisaccharide 4'-kinase n=1 Tax=Terrihabitans sp. B22-R8 TaxID=3425128 RepID=UPI00403CF8C8